MSYFQNIKAAIKTTGAGLRLSLNHLFQVRKKRHQSVQEQTYFNSDMGTATLQFPHETIPVPDNGRYKLHNEIDDCIVCDKCAKVCPVNCIEIVPIRSPEVFGQTSDGTAKRIYAEKFDIDMSKCMFCGLCTTVCPTECLTMTNEYDYSTFDITEHLFPFSEMTEKEISSKKSEWEAYQESKLSTGQPKAETVKMSVKPSTPSGRPVFRPKPIPRKRPDND